MRGSTSQCSMPGRRSQSTRASAPLRRRGSYQRAEELGQVGAVPHQQHILVLVAEFGQEVLKGAQRRLGRQGLADLDPCVVADLCTYE